MLEILKVLTLVSKFKKHTYTCTDINLLHHSLSKLLTHDLPQSQCATVLVISRLNSNFWVTWNTYCTSLVPIDRSPGLIHVHFLKWKNQTPRTRDHITIWTTTKMASPNIQMRTAPPGLPRAIDTSSSHRARWRQVPALSAPPRHRDMCDRCRPC